MGDQVKKEFIDAEDNYYSYGSKEAINFKLILLVHLKKITTLTCNEWHGGYTQQKFHPMGGGGITEKYYIQNSRDAFWNAVFCLYDLCFPYFDKKMQVSAKAINKDLDELPDKCKDNEGKINQKLYEELKMKLVRKLFRRLGAFLKRKDYFNQSYLEE